MTEYEKEWFEKDYYAILGVSETASKQEIKKKYRKLARELHPDANPGDESVEEKFKEVSAAYDVVGDKEKRARYDEVRKMGPIGGAFGGGRAPGGGSFSDAGIGDIGDLFGNIFGHRGGRGQRARRSAAAQGVRGTDLETNLSLGFQDAVMGTEAVLPLRGEVLCDACRGSGLEPGTTPSKCESCGGSGIHDENQGMFSFSRPCGSCGGRGSVIQTPCSACAGSGGAIRDRDIKVRIPAGVKNGQTIRIRKRGGPGRAGGPNGDLFVKIGVEPHEFFGRSGKDLTLTVPITFAEAALGADIKVPTLNGEVVKMRIPPGTESGKKFRLKGKGGKGDLLATAVVSVPQELNEEQRAAVEKLAEVTPEAPRARLGVR